jgi:DNA gyrase/topoisomerase IV subunit B
MPYSKIYKHAVSAKILLDESPSLEKLLVYMQGNNPGTWKIENNKIVSNYNGVDTEYHFNIESINKEIRYNLISFSKAWAHLWGKGVFASGHEILDPFDLLEMVMSKGRRGLQIQRYKGLGEMNARELGATAMKSYHQINLSEAELADKMCTDLMGENVTARRAFIEENARYAEVDL